MNITMLADRACHTGEGPIWDPRTDCVYWLDIPAGRIYRYDPATGLDETIFTGEPVGGMTLQADGSLLLFMARGAVRILDGGKLITVVESLPGEEQSRFNDVIADPRGRVFCGTMPSPAGPGRLYRLETDGAIEVVREDVRCANGLAFTPEGRGMYFTDTGRRAISLFDYDAATGALSNERVWVRVPESPGEGYPDGMTVDAEGCVWSGRWDGGCLVRYSPEGEEILRVALPARKVTSLTFGGPDLTDIYVTTAGGDRKGDDGPLAGALFHLNLGVRGVPEFVSRVRLS